MLHGDLACTVGTVVAFRCTGTLLKKKEGLFNSLLNRISGTIQRADIDESVQSVMNYLYWHTENVIDLVLFESEYSKEVEEYLAEHFPFNRILVVQSAPQITAKLKTGDVSYYVDNDEEFRSKINSEYAVSLSGLSNYVQTTGRRGERRE